MRAYRQSDEPPCTDEQAGGHPVIDRNGDAPLLELRGISKRFTAVEVFRSIDLSVRDGELWVLVGPNGAGKSTLMSLAVGLLRPDAGRVLYRGQPLRSRLRIDGFIEEPAFVPQYSGQRNLAAYLRLVGKPFRRPEVDRMAESVGLGPRELGRPVRSYSTGMRRKLGVLRALLADPDLYLFDEPTSGLDPGGVRDLRRIIRSLSSEQGKAVVLSTHLLSEAERFPAQLALLANGRLTEIANGTPATSEAPPRGYLVRIRTPASQRNRLVTLLSRLGLIEGAPEASTNGASDSVTIFRVDDQETGAAALRRIVEEGITVHEFSPRTCSLEEIYFQALGEGGAHDRV